MSCWISPVGSALAMTHSALYGASMSRDASADVLGAAEIANLLGVSRKHVNRLLSRGDIPSWRAATGGPRAAYLTHRADVERYKELNPPRRLGGAEMAAELSTAQAEV